MINNKILRTGYTTGTTATLASMTALHLLLTGFAPAVIKVPLPPFKQINPPQNPFNIVSLSTTCAGYGPAPEVSLCSSVKATHAGAIKDAGDDPDVTNKAIIFATIYPISNNKNLKDDFLQIDGGPGVGRITAPGLDLAPGEAAINPIPRIQIRYALLKLYSSLAIKKTLIKPPFRLIISVPNGEKLAIKTLNPRLGIIGGISILGTHGTVRPYSHSAFKETIKEQLVFAHAQGLSTICLATGRRSETFLMNHFPHFPKAAFIQVADFAHFALSISGKLFKNIFWGCFFGKLLKLACGNSNTHATVNPLDISWLTNFAKKKHFPYVKKLSTVKTAQAAFKYLNTTITGKEIINEIIKLAKENAQAFAAASVKIILFNRDGSIIGKE